MKSLFTNVSLWIHPDRRSLFELADFLRKRKKAASWWDHSHLTRRLATQQDAIEYRKLPREKRFILLQAARFCTSYYSTATLPALALGIVLIVPVILKQADSLAIPVNFQMTLVTAIALLLILVGLTDIYGASKSAAHAKTWVAAFEDVEKDVSLTKRRPQLWRHKARSKLPKK